jgi:hypothetical protein
VTVDSFDPRCIDYSDGSITVTIEGGTQEYLVDLQKSNGDGLSISSQSQSPPWTYAYENLEADTYNLTVTDAFNQTEIINGIQLIENSLDLTYESTGFSMFFLLGGSIDGVQYELINQNGDVKATPEGDGPSTFLIHTETPPVNPQGWRVRSEHGCSSNSL